MTDFWLSCGHHLLDRDQGGGLVVTDEFLKAYLARPELAPPPEACVVERTLHAALLADPRRPVAAGEVAAISDASTLRRGSASSVACSVRSTPQASGGGASSGRAR